MKKTLFILLILICTCTARAETPAERYGSLTNRLSYAIEAFKHDATIACTSNKWTASRDVTNFTVHGESKTGEYTDRLYQEIAPRLNGYIIEVNLLDLNPCAFEAGQIHRRPYWYEYMWHGCADDAHFVHVLFKFGKGVSEEFKQRIIKEINSEAQPSGGAYGSPAAGSPSAHP